MQKKYEHAFVAGIRAGNSGSPTNLNPFRPGSNEYIYWVKGWRAGGYDAPPVDYILQGLGCKKPSLDEIESQLVSDKLEDHIDRMDYRFRRRRSRTAQNRTRDEIDDENGIIDAIEEIRRSERG